MLEKEERKRETERERDIETGTEEIFKKIM